MIRIAFCLFAFLTFPASAQPLEDLINSGVVPKLASNPTFRKVMYSRLAEGGNEVSIFLSRRRSGTRTPIHTHSSVAISCLIEGEETFFVDNRKPVRISAPECFLMPTGVRMISVMTGTKDTFYYSIFTGPKGFPYWEVNEGGVSSQMSDDFNRYEHQH